MYIAVVMLTLVKHRG